jgi:uncharacterized protein
MKKRLAPRIILLLIAAGISSAQSSAPQLAPVKRNVTVPMRDGVELRADIFLPQGNGPFPTLVYRTPYGKDDVPKDYSTVQAALARGYAVVVQDVRGRYHSAGEFRPYEHEGRDGYDTIEWAAKQKWSNGNVGTFGLSYPGAVQWLAAVEDPPHLKAMVPAMTFASPRNFFYTNGVFDNSWSTWIYFNIAPDLRVKKHLSGPKTRDDAVKEWPKVRDRILGTIPLNAMPDLKEVAPFYYDWMKHPPEDRWWDFAELAGKYARTKAAVLNYSGWYDEYYGPDGAFKNFQGLLSARKGQKDPRTQLIVGPWMHGTSSFSTTTAGDRDFGPSAGLDYDTLVLDWMDRYVKGDRTVEVFPKPIRLFVMGADRWRNADSWPLPNTRFTSFFLSSQEGKKNGVLQPRRPHAKSSYSEFLSDPADPTVDPNDSRGAHDYAPLAARPDVLAFDSVPFAADTEVTGPLQVDIFISTDAVDTDLWARILDVGPDGRAESLMYPGLDVMRASYRDDGQRRLLIPGQIYRLRFSKMVTSNVFLKGHRLRIQISTSLHPHYSRNLHTGESELTSSNMRKAKIRIHHDRQHASKIVLPVIP